MLCGIQFAYPDNFIPLVILILPLSSPAPEKLFSD
jgi:hypothetical protein